MLFHLKQRVLIIFQGAFQTALTVADLAESGKRCAVVCIRLAAILFKRGNRKLEMLFRRFQLVQAVFP